MKDWDAFQEKYSAASNEVRDLIDSEKIPDFVAQIKNELALTATSGTIITQVSDVALGLQTPAAAVQSIIADDKIPPEKQTELTQKLVTFLQEHVPDFSAAEAAVAQPEISAVPAPDPQPMPAPKPEPKPEAPSVPRYAKPLTDLPKYDDQQQ